MIFRLLLLSVPLLTLCNIALAQNADVNAERASMDMYLLKSIDGSQLLGRMAVWPQSVLNITADNSDTLNAYDNYVMNYYGPVNLLTDTTNGLEFAQSSYGRFRGLALNDGTARLQLDLSLMMRGGITDDNNASDFFLLARPSFRMMGSLGRNFGFFLDLSNGARISGNSSQIAKTDPTLSRIPKFTGEDTTFFDRYIGYMQFQNEWLRIRFGREAIQFGFSPIDNFVHSIDAPLLDGLLIDVPYKAFRFTMTHSGANGTDTAGNAVPSKFIATHRIAFDPVNWLSIGVNDMIVYWGRGVDFAYLNPLAFYVSAGLNTTERNHNDNSLLGFDVAIRPIAGTMFYGALLIDDLSYSTLGDTSVLGNNNKFAFQLGASQAIGSPLNQMRSLASVEYVRIDPFTLTHRSINASYTTFDAPIGYDMQPNSDRVALQWRTWFTPRTYVRVDFDYTRHGENILDSTGNIQIGEDPNYPGSGAMVAIGNVGGDILRGDGDNIQGNKFLRGNLSYQRRVRLTFSAEWWSNIFTDVRVGYTNRSGGNTPEDFLFASFEVRVGY